MAQVEAAAAGLSFIHRDSTKATFPKAASRDESENGRSHSAAVSGHTGGCALSNTTVKLQGRFSPVVHTHVHEAS